MLEHHDTIAAYEKLCADLGEDPANVGLAWLLSRKGVTAPIIGPRTTDQLTGAVRSLEITLDEDSLTRLDELFPPLGPNADAKSGAKPAPEAYAW